MESSRTGLEFPQRLGRLARLFLAGAACGLCAGSLWAQTCGNGGTTVVGSGPSAVTLSLNLQVRCNNQTAQDQRFGIQIINYGSKPVSLANLCVKAWAFQSHTLNIAQFANSNGTIYDNHGNSTNISLISPTVSVSNLSSSCTTDPNHEANQVASFCLGTGGVTIPSGGGTFVSQQGALDFGVSPNVDGSNWADDYSHFGNGAIDGSACTGVTMDSPYYALYYNGNLVQEVMNASGTIDTQAGHEPCSAFALCSPTLTPTASYTPSSTVTSTATQTATSTPNRTATEQANETATEQAIQSFTPTATPTSSVTSTPTLTATSTPNLTATEAAKETATENAVLSYTATPTATPNLTATEQANETATEQAIQSFTATPSNTPSATPNLTATEAAKETATENAILSFTATPSNTPTATPNLTATEAAKETATENAVLSFTATPSNTPTATPNLTATEAAKETATENAVLSFTATPSNTPTATPNLTATEAAQETATENAVLSFTATPSNTPSATPNLTATEAAKETATENAVLSFTATPSNTPTATPNLTATEAAKETVTENAVLSFTATPTPTDPPATPVFTNTQVVSGGPTPVLGPNPAPRTQPICLYPDKPVNGSEWDIFNFVGENLVHMGYSGPAPECFTPSTYNLPPGLYLVRLKLVYADGTRNEVWKKLVLSP